MAQNIDNLQNNQRGNVKKVVHNWSFDPVSKKDLNKSQWPFKVVRDKGKATRMDIRSLTDLNKSFDGTPYNLNDCQRVKSRYSMLFDKFRELNKNRETTPFITHLLITFDTVYYLVERKDTSKDSVNVELRSFKYCSSFLKVDDSIGLVSGILYRSKYLETNIKKLFKIYNETNDLVYFNSLRKEVESYINMRKKIRVLDNNKYIVDVLKSEINFTSLKYLVFIPTPKSGLDFYNVVIDELIKNNINPSQIQGINELMSKIPNLENEYNEILNFKESLEKGDFYRSVRKMYLLQSRELNNELVLNLFNSITGDTFNIEPIYISDAEKVRKKKIEEKRKNELENSMVKVNELEVDVKKSFGEVLDILTVMNSMMRETNEIHRKGLENNTVEYTIWINDYNPTKVKSRIDAVYNYWRQNKSKGEKLESYPLREIFKTIQENIGLFGSIDALGELNYFYEYIMPSYFCDDRLTLSRYGIEEIKSNTTTQTIKNLENLKKVIKAIRTNFIVLFEVFLGIQYALFGVFMKRYGLEGLEFAKMLVKDLVEQVKGKPFNITENVKETSNIAFYTILRGVEHINEYNPETIALISDGNGIGGFAYFVTRYLKEISETELNVLVHGNDEDLKYYNLMQVSFSIIILLEKSRKLVKLDISNKETIEKIVEVINRNK